MKKHSRAWHSLPGAFVSRTCLLMMRSYVNFRWPLTAALLPLLLAGLFVLVVEAQGLVRYDPTYFTATYAERYDTPGAVVRALERALQTDDQALLAELQGLRRPASFETGSSMIFVMLWERSDRYISYLYLDMQTYERYVHYVEQRGDRWVVAPPDAYYYLHSGRWLTVFTPVALVWWLLEMVVILMMLVFRLSARLRARLISW